MIIRISQVVIYIFLCFFLRVGPWRYFQLNARYFNHSKGIFSKLDIDKLIPKQWRLPQWVDHSGIQPESYPVFLKPEWGQNSKGIQCAHSQQEFEHLRLLKPNSNVQYLVQQGARGKIEYEVFIIPNPSGERACLSITQVINHSRQVHPINGIYNPETEYLDISDGFDSDQKQQIFNSLRRIGEFNIARFGLRADSIDAMLAGNFQIIEINLFFPMPLMLLSKNVSWMNKWSFVFTNMWLLARVTKAMPDTYPYKDIFFKKMAFFQHVKDFNKPSASEKS